MNERLRPFLIAAVLSAMAACVASPGSSAPEPSAPAPEAASAACASAEHHAFDFWIGEWDVFTTGTDTLRGSSRISATDGGCVITEQYVTPDGGYSGRSLNLYDAASGRWEQFWVDNQGDLTHFVGGPDPSVPGADMRLTDEADFAPDGSGPVMNRMTFTADADGTVHQHGETSMDSGASWTTSYDLTYRPRAVAAD